MLIRWFLLLLAAASAALGLLTIAKAPEWLAWTFSVLAGEYGYWVALVPLATVAVAGWGGFPRDGLKLATIGLALLGAALLLNPCAQAWWIARRLPARLTQAFGGRAGRPAPPFRSAPPFSFTALFRSDTKPVPFDTLSFSPGLALDFYRAATPGPVPCIVVLHGGGWNSGERGEIPTLNYRLSRDGYAVADASYRLAPQGVWPAQRDDVHAALDYLKAHAAQLGIDPSRFVLFGRSAGGQIAEATAYAVKDPSIRGLVGFYSPADMNFAYEFGREDDILKSLSLLRAFLGGPPATAQAAYDSASSILLANPSSPPTLLVHGRLDTLVWYRQSTRLAAKLQSAGVPHLLVTLPWATHAVEYHEYGPSGQLAYYALEWFLASVTR